MILLKCNTQHIFWLGRYLTRIRYLCTQLPFYNNQQALAYAHAFCLPAFDASSLNVLLLDTEQPSSFNHQFEYAKESIQALRGVLSETAYSELNQQIRNAHHNNAYICEAVAECHEVLEAESEYIFIFFILGENIEQLDRQIRLKQDYATTLMNLDKVISLLSEMGWSSLNCPWQKLKLTPDSMNFYHFSDHIENLFQVDSLIRD